MIQPAITMKHAIRISLAIAAAVIAAVTAAYADPPALPPLEPVADNLSPMRKVYRGKYHTLTEEGDTVLVLVFNEITVYPPLKFKNKKQEEFYWRTVRDVKKALPYARLITATLLETYEYIETFPTQAERERYLKEMEGAVFKQYKPVLKKFTKSQAKNASQAHTPPDRPKRLRHTQSLPGLFPRYILARLRQAVRRKPERGLPPRLR